MDFKDKVVLITGSSSGIGAGTAELLSTFGASLVLVGRNLDNLQKVEEKCIKAAAPGTPKPLTLQADVTLEADVTRIIDETLKKFQKLDVLINNAGIIGVGSIEQTSLEQYDSIMNTNMRSIYHLTMLAVPHLIKTQGCIVNVSSVNGIRAFAGVLAYCVSKAALDQFTRCTALELAAKKVRVNAVNPGVIVTEIHKRGGMDEQAYQAFLEKCKQTHALGRPGKVDEVAQAIAFLANNELSSFITGASLPIDGGRHAMCPR
ncbi:3-oxoacyl-[acyl-carrier-protein] reductase FabG-like [Culicoides brevitarsis]|uniref:3-oxoacyl-[acyl-carrier-protein] reductase FabG-like n=1 Tax=Culicoides brevitarsis TaxID=469753 RepID=UPI00307BFEF9